MHCLETKCGELLGKPIKKHVAKNGHLYYYVDPLIDVCRTMANPMEIGNRKPLGRYLSGDKQADLLKGIAKMAGVKPEELWHKVEVGSHPGYWVIYDLLTPVLLYLDDRFLYEANRLLLGISSQKTDVKMGRTTYNYKQLLDEGLLNGYAIPFKNGKVEAPSVKALGDWLHERGFIHFQKPDSWVPSQQMIRAGYMEKRYGFTKDKNRYWMVVITPLGVQFLRETLPKVTVNI